MGAKGIGLGDVADFEKIKFENMNTIDLKNETPADANNVLAAAVCHKCRTKDFDTCHSIRCPIRKEEETVKTKWDIRKCFEQLRFDKDHHLGMGDIRLTIRMQEEICELVERFYRCR